MSNWSGSQAHNFGKSRDSEKLKHFQFQKKFGNFFPLNSRCKQGLALEVEIGEFRSSSKLQNAFSEVHQGSAQVGFGLVFGFGGSSVGLLQLEGHPSLTGRTQPAFAAARSTQRFWQSCSGGRCKGL